MTSIGTCRTINQIAQDLAEPGRKFNFGKSALFEQPNGSSNALNQFAMIINAFLLRGNRAFVAKTKI